MSDDLGLPPEEPVAPEQKDDKKRRRIIFWVSLGLVAVVVIALVIFWALRPAGEPDPTPTATVSETPTPTPSATQTPTPTPTPADPDTISLPTECSEAFSPAFFEGLSSSGLPLNDPTVADSPITKSESVERLRESLDHLRCTWGAASETGILSAVNIVDEPQRNAVISALGADGYTCADEAIATVCTIEFLDDSGEFAAAGETHYLRGNGWISSYWTQIDFSGYNEDIVATLWG
ncbi:hypothetical protein ACLRGF_04450 [Mycetocola zhadangensis]|uniref:hypothetical protein n=1 Tax=Mycetocola zhadangensis TaxID=1164595 RepID=UPI003A4E56B7